MEGLWTWGIGWRRLPGGTAEQGEKKWEAAGGGGWGVEHGEAL